ncbi:MAG: CbtA family protein [Alphaproteobacteria bacterium]|nr:CbtA family protein [Alphaproteobacteria bacterium]
MIGRYILAALIAGLLAGLVMGGIQHFILTPLVATAEMFEKQQRATTTTAGATKLGCVENTLGGKICEHDHEGGWQPTEGWQRTGLTFLASMMSGAGFALVLAGVSFIAGLPITRENGLIWGICGFLAVSLAPAAGLAPELPGMPTADLQLRQMWWALTVAATGLGLWLLAAKPAKWAHYAAILFIAVPHIWGAPIALSSDAQVNPSLAAEFVGKSLAANAIFWALIGTFLAHAFFHLNQKYPQI